MSKQGEKANREFTCSYQFDGCDWCVHVWASTHEEAEMKLKAMGRGKVDGVVAGTIPYEGRCPTCGQECDPQ
jgi:hypothetical protein